MPPLIDIGLRIITLSWSCQLNISVKSVAHTRDASVLLIQAQIKEKRISCFSSGKPKLKAHSFTQCDGVGYDHVKFPYIDEEEVKLFLILSCIVEQMNI